LKKEVLQDGKLIIHNEALRTTPCIARVFLPADIYSDDIKKNGRFLSPENTIIKTCRIFALA
jgi:hypothetical protein